MAKPKPEKKTKAATVIPHRLKGFIERIERLIEERDAIAGDIKDVFAEAKGVGYDIKTMRKVIQLRAMDAADRAEMETLLDVYLNALGMADRIVSAVQAGATYREAADAEGTSATKVHRLVTKTRGKNEPHESEQADPSTGEVIESPTAGVEPLAEGHPASGFAGEAEHGDGAQLYRTQPRLASDSKLASGDSNAAADCGVSPEPAAVSPAVNADPLAGRVSPRTSSGQGSEVGTNSKLDRLITGSIARVNAMSDVECEAMYAAQRESWVRGEIGMGSDADEAAYRANLRHLTSHEQKMIQRALRASVTVVGEVSDTDENAASQIDAPISTAARPVATTPLAVPEGEVGSAPVRAGNAHTPVSDTDESCGDGHAPVSAETQPRAPGLDGRAAPAVATGEGAGIQSGPHETDPWDDVLAHKRRLDEMKRAKGFAA